MNLRNSAHPPAVADETHRSPDPPGRPRTHANPYLLYGIVFGALAVLLALLIWWITKRFDQLLTWLIAISAVTFAAYGYDKAIAGSGRVRVPEGILLGLTFAGGTIGALAGMRFFHHKTIKRSFRRRFWAVVVLQGVLVVAYLLWR